MWLLSVTKDGSGLILNHGQHLDIPGLIIGRKNRLYIGLAYKNQNVPFFRFDEHTIGKLIEKIKIIRVQPNNAPKFLQPPEDYYTAGSIPKARRIG